MPYERKPPYERPISEAEQKEWDEREVADVLHDTLCRLNHIDECSYDYETWGVHESQKYSARSKWLKSARAVLATRDKASVISTLSEYQRIRAEAAHARRSWDE